MVGLESLELLHSDNLWNPNIVLVSETAVLCPTASLHADYFLHNIQRELFGAPFDSFPIHLAVPVSLVYPWLLNLFSNEWYIHQWPDWHDLHVLNDQH
jgi:hypothetical protein